MTFQSNIFFFNLWRETQVWKRRAMGPLEEKFYQVHLKLWEDCWIMKADWGICLTIKNISLCYATPLFSTAFYWGVGEWFFQNKFSAAVEHRERFLPCVCCFCSILNANFLSDLLRLSLTKKSLGLKKPLCYYFFLNEVKSFSFHRHGGDKRVHSQVSRRHQNEGKDWCAWGQSCCGADEPEQPGRMGNRDLMKFREIQQGLSQNRKGVAKVKFIRGTPRWSGVGSTCPTMRGWGSWECGEDTALEVISEQPAGALGTSRICHLHRGARLEEQQWAYVETGEVQTGNKEKALTSWDAGSLPKEVKQSVFLEVFKMRLDKPWATRAALRAVPILSKRLDCRSSEVLSSLKYLVILWFWPNQANDHSCEIKKKKKSKYDVEMITEGQKLMGLSDLKPEQHIWVQVKLLRISS